MNSFLECNFHWFKALNCKLKPSTSFYPYRSQENSPTDGRRKILYAALPDVKYASYSKTTIPFSVYIAYARSHARREHSRLLEESMKLNPSEPIFESNPIPSRNFLTGTTKLSLRISTAEL